LEHHRTPALIDYASLETDKVVEHFQTISLEEETKAMDSMHAQEDTLRCMESNAEAIHQKNKKKTLKPPSSVSALSSVLACIDAPCEQVNKKARV
jgi:hypothetical protein